MSNLSCASCLVTLKFISIHPSNLRQGDWPLCMPELEVGVLREMDQLPQQLCNDPKLCDLDLSDFRQPDLPAWFAELTQITSLQLSGSTLTAFPMAIIQLSQLCSLFMDGIVPPMVIGPEIASILQWKSLKQIDLTASDYSLDSQLYLLEVYHQLKSRNVRMELSDGL